MIGLICEICVHPCPISYSRKEKQRGTQRHISRYARFHLRKSSIVWLGQVVSLVGSGLTSFALGLWVYERTGSVTQYALIGLVTVLPGVVLSSLAGVLVDRWDRRWVMMLKVPSRKHAVAFLVVGQSA